MVSQMKLHCRTTSISALPRTALRAHICSSTISRRQTLTMCASLALHTILSRNVSVPLGARHFLGEDTSTGMVFSLSPFSIRERNPRTIPFSSLFSFTRHEAISGLLQGRKSARRTRTGQRKRDVFFRHGPCFFRMEHVPTLFAGYLESRRRIVSIARYSYSFPADFFLPSLRNTTQKTAAVALSVGATKKQGESVRIVSRRNNIQRGQNPEGF